jgi:hypothetical protein
MLTRQFTYHDVILCSPEGREEYYSQRGFTCDTQSSGSKPLDLVEREKAI